MSRSFIEWMKHVNTYVFDGQLSLEQFSRFVHEPGENAPWHGYRLRNKNEFVCEKKIVNLKKTSYIPQAKFRALQEEKYVSGTENDP